MTTFDIQEQLRTGHPQPPNRMKTLVTLAFLVVIVWLVLSFTSCSFSVAADGAKSFSIDGEQAAKAIRVLTEK